MQKKKEVVRRYGMSDANLKQLADKILLFIDEDIADFEGYGFTPTRRSEFGGAIQTFDDFPPDERLEGQQMTTTQNKDRQRELLESKMKAIVLKAQNKFGSENGRMREFGSLYYSRMTDEELVRAAKLVAAAASDFLQDLLSEGLDAAQIQDIKQTIRDFDEALDLQAKAIAKRDSQTELRIEAGNSLYELVVKYAAIGKTVWEGRSEARYNDYVIYDTPSTTPPPPADTTL